MIHHGSFFVTFDGLQNCRDYNSARHPQRLDLVIINQCTKSIIIFELTIPFERNINSAHDRKLNKYAGLASDLREQGYDTKLICVEICSRGLISNSNKRSLQSIFPLLSISKKLRTRASNKMLKSLSQRAITCSYS